MAGRQSEQTNGKAASARRLRNGKYNGDMWAERKWHLGEMAIIVNRWDGRDGGGVDGVTTT